MATPGQRALAAAERQLGTPYVWGGETAGKGFDCSGLVQWAYQMAGIRLPRTAAQQGSTGHRISYGALQPGDLLVEGNGGHVVMYAGGGRVIEAPHTGEDVKYAPLSWFPSGQFYAVRPYVGGSAVPVAHAAAAEVGASQQQGPSMQQRQLLAQTALSQIKPVQIKLPPLNLPTAGQSLSKAFPTATLPALPTLGSSGPTISSSPFKQETDQGANQLAAIRRSLGG